jgi:hypothetical protein
MKIEIGLENLQHVCLKQHMRRFFFGTRHSLLSQCFPTLLYCEEYICIRKEHRLRVFENRVLRIIFGSKRDEVTGEWRKLHIEELHNLYSCPRYH